MRKIVICIIIVAALLQADPTVHTVGVGVRAFGMANNFTALSNDFSATFWNPAGLAFVPVRELHFAMNGNDQQQKSTLDNLTTESSFRRYHVNSAGLLRSMPTSRGGFAFAIGFSSPYQLDDLNYARGADRYQGSDTIFGGSESDPQILTKGEQLFRDKYDHRAYGQLNEWCAGLGWQVGPGLGFGFSVGLLMGGEQRDYEIASLAGAGPFEHYTVGIERTYIGYDARLGLLYTPIKEFTLGARLEIPRTALVMENYSTTDLLAYNPFFDTTSTGRLSSSLSGALGAALQLPYLILSSDITFRSPHPDVPEGSDLSYWKEGIGIGIEVPIRWIYAVVRAGYSYSQFDLSPFKLSWEGQAWDGGAAVDAPGQQLVTGGISIVASKNIALDMAYGLMTWDFDSKSSVWNTISEKHKLQQGSVSLAIRY